MHDMQLTRRGFIGRTLSCGALFAASRLPAFADEPTVFPARRDNTSRFSLFIPSPWFGIY